MKISLKNLQKNRISIFMVLLAMLILLCIYYIDNYQMHQSFTSSGMVIVSGTVTETFNGGFYIISFEKNPYKIISPVKVSKGDSIETKGIIDGKYNIYSTETIITPRWSPQSVMLRSFMALLVFLFIFNRYWRFDFKEKIFRRIK